MTSRRSKAYVWSADLKDLRKKAELRDFQRLQEDITALVWATIYCRTSTMKVGDAYPALRELLRNFKVTWGERKVFYAVEEMRLSPIGFYDGAVNGFVFPTLKKAVNIVYPGGKPCIS